MKKKTLIKRLKDSVQRQTELHGYSKYLEQQLADKETEVHQLTIDFNKLQSKYNKINEFGTRLSMPKVYGKPLTKTSKMPELIITKPSNMSCPKCHTTMEDYDSGAWSTGLRCPKCGTMYVEHHQDAMRGTDIKLVEAWYNSEEDYLARNAYAKKDIKR